MIETLTEAGSTNTVFATRISAGEHVPEGFWLRAERQTAGRGRSGRNWAAAEGNLYCSTVVHLQPEDPAAHTLSLVAGLSVHDLLSTQFLAGGFDEPPERWLKWPNDLLYHGAKIAGILCERVADAVIVGIGVNVASAPELPDRRTTAIQLQDSHNADDAGNVLARLVPLFANRLSQWRAQPLAATIDAWLERAHEEGTRLTVTDGDTRSDGTFAGLADDGALRLRLLDGTHRIIHAGDVEWEG